MAHAQTWHEDRPIYRQLMEQIVARIIDQTYREGELLPSVRQIASDYLVNPLTAARAYREAGAGRLIAIATHGVFAGDGAQRIVASGLFDAIAVTDSHPNSHQDGVIVRSVAPLFATYVAK